MAEQTLTADQQRLKQLRESANMPTAQGGGDDLGFSTEGVASFSGDLIPDETWCLCRVVSAKPGRTKSSNAKKFDAELVIIESETANRHEYKGRHIWDMFFPDPASKAVGRCIAFASALGMYDKANQKVTMTTTNVLNQDLWVKVGLIPGDLMFDKNTGEPVHENDDPTQPQKKWQDKNKPSGWDAFQSKDARPSLFYKTAPQPGTATPKPSVAQNVATYIPADDDDDDDDVAAAPAAAPAPVAAAPAVPADDPSLATAFNTAAEDESAEDESPKKPGAAPPTPTAAPSSAASPAEVPAAKANKGTWSAPPVDED